MIADVEVITWLIPPPTQESAYHTRIHKAVNKSSRKIVAAEGGFAIHSQFGPAESERRFPKLSKLSEGQAGRYQTANCALGVSKQGVSGIVDLASSGAGTVQDVDANSNIMVPRTVIPMVMSDLRRGETWLSTRVYAVPFNEKVGLETKGWLAGWRECEMGIGGMEGVRKEYPFIG